MQKAKEKQAKSNGEEKINWIFTLWNHHESQFAEKGRDLLCSWCCFGGKYKHYLPCTHINHYLCIFYEKQFRDLLKISISTNVYMWGALRNYMNALINENNKSLNTSWINLLSCSERETSCITSRKTQLNNFQILENILRVILNKILCSRSIDIFIACKKRKRRKVVLKLNKFFSMHTQTSQSIFFIEK